ncbi:MAG: FAD-dependent oxidoreductase [Kiritimatiellae bacterium]|nr:FAD-dependent oxidoreductase [Kiritimatiellia bacterium]
MSARTVRESERKIEVLDEMDVVVAGAGVSGCAAAASAARAGAKTILLERNGCLGGVATATLMANIGNRFLTGSGRQVIHGFGGELVERLVAQGAASPHWKSRDLPGVVIDSEKLKVVLIDVMYEAGVTVLTHALATQPIVNGDGVTGVFLESRSGRQALLARAVVDATGEADLAFRAGSTIKEQSVKGSASILFKLARVDLDRFVDFVLEDPEGFPAGVDWVKDAETFGRNWRERGVLFFPHVSGRHWRFMIEAVAQGKLEREIGPAGSLDAVGMYALRGRDCIVINSNFYRVQDLDVRTLSVSELHAQKMCYYVADFFIRHVPGFERAYVAHVGVDLGIRTSRQIAGRVTLSREMLRDAPAPTRFDDVIGVTPVQDTKRESGEFFKEFTTDIPFGALVPCGGPANLVNASAKSIDTEPRGLIRGMSGCMICGQAAGVAAALAAKRGVAVADVPTRDLQRALLRQHVNLGDASRIKALGLL